MIDIVQGTITLGGETHEIHRFEVWWQTPFGLVEERTEAIARVSEAGLDLDARLVLRPVPIAISMDRKFYEALVFM